MYSDWMEEVPIFVDKGCRDKKMYERIDELERCIRELERCIRDLENKEYIR